MSYNKASLVLIPSGYKEGKAFSQKPVNGNGDFNVTSSATTRVNADGLIEKETQNLLLKSNNFYQSPWTKLNVTVTGGHTGYDGSSDAFLLESTATSGRIYQNASISGVMTYSVYAKAGSVNWMALYINASPTPYCFFDLVNVALGQDVGGNSVARDIVDVGNGWVRCSVSFASNGNTTDFRIFPATNNGGLGITGSNIYIQDTQVEYGLVARDYLETTDSAVYSGMTDDVPQLDYFGNSCPAYLFEPERTNLVIHSEYLEGLNQNTLNLSLSTNLSPEGKYNAYRAERVSGSQLGFSFAATSGETYTTSIYARSISGSGQIKITDYQGSENTFNITSDWARYELSEEATQSTGRAYVRLPQIGDVVEFYGLQSEQGSYATSYIPTYGTATTRIRNIFVKSVTSLYDIQNDFSFVMHYRDTDNSTGSQALVSVNTNTPNNFNIYLNSNRINIYVTNGGGYIFGSGANGSWTGPTTKIAITWNNGTKELKYFINGSLFDSGIFPDHSYGTNTSVVTNFAGNNAKGSLEKFLFYKVALSDQECIDITT